MTTAWTLTTGEICTDALEHLGAIADGEPATGGDMQTALKALDGVLKELPLHGYCWPALTAEVPLAWISGQAVDLPSDFYGYPVAWNAFGVRLTQIPHAVWVSMPDRAATGEAVTHFAISPASELLLWPVVDSDPALTLQYQRIVSDADLAASPSLPQYWINPLGYGVANELALKFGAPQDKRAEIAQRWAAKRERALASSIAAENISFEVRD